MMLDQETLDFLARPLLMRLATIGSDGYPQVTPVWYWCDPIKQRLYVSTESQRIKFRNIQRDPRVGVAIDDDTTRDKSRPYRGVSIKGDAHEVMAPHDTLAMLVTNIVSRYFGPDEVQKAFQWLFVGDRVVIEIEPLHVAKVGAGWRGL